MRMQKYKKMLEEIHYVDDFYCYKNFFFYLCTM